MWLSWFVKKPEHFSGQLDGWVGCGGLVPVGGLDVVTMKEGGKKLARLLPFWWVSWVGEWVGGCGVVGRGVTADAWKGAGFQAYAARGGRGVKKTRTPWPKPQAPNPRYPRTARQIQITYYII